MSAIDDENLRCFNVQEVVDDVQQNNKERENNVKNTGVMRKKKERKELRIKNTNLQMKQKLGKERG